MKTNDSVLVHSSDVHPVEHWERVIPNVRLIQLEQAGPYVPPAELVWVCSDVHEWQDLVTALSSAGTKVVVLTWIPEPAEMNRALACGARAYLPALSNERVFQQAAATVMAGGLWFPESLLANLVQTIASVVENREQPLSAVDLNVLTPREQDVALRAAKGDSNRSIAAELGITERTVKEHMGSVFRKMAVRDRMQLMLLVNGQLANGKQP